MFKNKLLISEDKKDIVEVISTNGCEICCDNKPMKELVANSTDAAQEKHVPQVSVEDNKLKVVVGSVEHPMLEAHYITNIWVEYSDGTVDRAGLVPGMKPEYVFDSKGRTGKVTVYEYCNLHGLWKNEIEL